MNFENLKILKKHRTLSKDDVLIGVAQRSSKKNQTLIKVAKFIQVNGTLETQSLTLNNQCGQLIGLAVDKTGLPLDVLKLSTEDLLLKILSQTQLENTTGLMNDPKSTFGSKSQLFGERRWNNSVVMMKIRSDT